MNVGLEAVLDHYGVEHFGRRKIRCFNPAHDDRVASCTLDVAKDVWFCHACDTGGGPMQVIMLMEKVDYARAAEYAAAHGLGEGDSTVRGARRRLGRVPVGTKGYQPKYRRHVPAWKRPD